MAADLAVMSSFLKKRPESKIRVIHLITDLDTGGAEVSLLKLLSWLDRDVLDLVVICLKDGPLRGPIEALSIPVYQLGMVSGLTSVKKIPKLIELTRKLRPDILHGWMIHGNLAAELSAVFAATSVRVLWSVRAGMGSLHTENRATAALIRLGARFSSRPFCVLYNSKTGAREHEDRGYDPRRTKIIPNGFDCDLFRPDAGAREAVRRELALSERSTLIGLIARHHPVKDHATFFRAAAALVCSVSEAHFLLAGRGIDNSNSELTAQINNLGLQDRVHLLGERSDGPRLTAALDIASLCSVAEAFPNTIGEAMACGVPCVATDVGDCRWILGDTGCVVPPGDPVALAKAWQDILKLSPWQYKKLGDAARDRIMREFSIDVIAGQYESLYLEMLGGNRTEFETRFAGMG